MKNVDNVENLSTEIVGKIMLTEELWIMWKTYPQRLWIKSCWQKSCGKCGKLIHRDCG